MKLKKENEEMKKILLILFVICSASVWAIDFPVYQGADNNARQNNMNVQSHALDREAFATPVIGGGYTTTGEYGMSSTTGTGRSSNMRRGAGGGGGFPSTRPDGTPLQPGDWCVVSETTYYWDGADWITDFMGGAGQNVDPGVAGNGSPVGDPTWPMLVFVLMAAGVICMRRIYSFGEKKSEIEEK